MKIYIASSWKNRAAVEMLADLLTKDGNDVYCFTRHADNIEQEVLAGTYSFDKWVMSPSGEAKFDADLDAVHNADLMVYLGPAGTDAWAEVGAAWAFSIPIIGILAKGEPAGLMRRMVDAWYEDYTDVLFTCQRYQKAPDLLSHVVMSRHDDEPPVPVTSEG